MDSEEAKTRVDMWEIIRRRFKQDYMDLGLSEERADDEATKRVRHIVIEGRFDA